MYSRYAASIGSACAVVLLGAGCASNGGNAAQSTYASVSPVSDSGIGTYLGAQQRYRHARLSGVEGSRRAAELRSVARLLEAALVNDPDNPLFHSTLADVLFELSPTENADAIESHHAAALRIAGNDWTASWLGLAELSATRGDRGGAARMLANAERSIGNVEFELSRDRTPKPVVIPIANIAVPGTGPNKRGASMRAAAAEQRASLVASWLAAGECWAPESSAESAGGSIDSGALFARLRARCAYLRVVLLSDRRDDGAYVAALRAVLKLDADFFPARLELARAYSRAGQFDAANDVLQPMLIGPTARFTLHPCVLLEAVANAVAQLERAPRDDDARVGAIRADGLFLAFHRAFPRHAQGSLLRARFCALVASRLKRPALYVTAQEWLRFARSTESADALAQDDVRAVEAMLDQGRVVSR